jgi:hypothetical protein
VDDRVAIRAAFEPHPLTLKGAFVVRGADGMPHQVRLESARLVEIGGRGGLPVPIGSAIIEAAPTMDTFVPFEVGISDLRPGWYELECSVVIDADASVVRPGKRFAVPWPRSSVRRGTFPIGVTAGDVTLETLECTGDSVRIAYAGDRPPAVKLLVDGVSHPLLDVEHDEEAGRGRILGYPAMRGHETLTVEVRGADPVAVRLP